MTRVRRTMKPRDGGGEDRMDLERAAALDVASGVRGVGRLTANGQQQEARPASSWPTTPRTPTPRCWSPPAPAPPTASLCS